jgi:hypothetical protein
MKFSQIARTLFLVVFTAQMLTAQILDNFSDGNFDQNPVWLGDAANFIVNPAGELQLNATAAGQSVLFTSGNIPDSTIWEFDVRLTFDPSNQNLVRIYLQLDQADLITANGYYLEMGETGSADAIRFFRLDAGVKTQLATGQPGLAASTPNLNFRVTRSSSGFWALEAANVGTALQPQFSLSENTWPGGLNRFFGFQCVYTISNAARFYFDNVNIRPDVPDTQPPVLVSAQANNPTQVTVVFNENLDLTSAENPAHYTINNSIGQALSATLSPDQKTVTLGLQNALVTGTYTLQTNGVKDLAGNESGVQSTDFQHIKIDIPVEFDIIITEIMADPTPGVGLPEVEWLEIFNRSNKVFDLSNVRINDATGAPVTLPSYLLQANEYVVLAATANAVVLQAVTAGKVLGIPISSSILNNESDILTISNLSGNIIDRVAYDVGWHTVPGKDNGGYSLERINTSLPCLGGENWQSCPAQIGGTPAAQNASFSLDPDNTQPRLLKVFPESASSLLLTFTEGLDRASAEDAAAYQLSPNIAVAAAEQLPNDRALVRLSLATPLQVSVLYTLSVENSVEDCSGNSFQFTDSIFFGLSERPDIQDIVINEILFNPASGLPRYLEVYNRSQKIFDWSEFFMASNSDTSSSVVPILQERLFLPGEYHVFSTDASKIYGHYDNIIQKNVLQNALPSLDDNVDSIKIYWVGNGQTVTVDSFFYRRGMHNRLLSTSEQEGVALERIRTDGPTQDASNWTSASSLKTGAPGSPTLPNTQSRMERAPSAELISIPVARLSPDGDGYEDFLEIYYALPQEGYAASLSIFDADGNLVKQLVRQQLIGIEGVVRWDGDTDAGEGVKTRPGIHVLYFEIFGPNGDVQRIKKAVAVVGRF